MGKLIPQLAVFTGQTGAGGGPMGARIRQLIDRIVEEAKALISPAPAPVPVRVVPSVVRRPRRP
jgi:hypothetical protein